MKKLIIPILAALFVGHPGLAANSNPSEPSKRIVATGMLPPWISHMVLLADPCPTHKDGQVIVASFRNEEGLSTGCWVRAMDAVFVAWDDGNSSSFTLGRFTWTDGPKADDLTIEPAPLGPNT